MGGASRRALRSLGRRLITRSGTNHSSLTPSTWEMFPSSAYLAGLETFGRSQGLFPHSIGTSSNERSPRARLDQSGARRGRSVAPRQLLKLVQGRLLGAIDRDGKAAEGEAGLIRPCAPHEPGVGLRRRRAVVDVEGNASA